MSDDSLPAGRFVWHDLNTTDVPAALAYYRDLMGWDYKEVEMGGFGRYSMIHVAGTEHGGFTPLDAAQGTPSHWISYVVVPDVDAACAKTLELGGQVHLPGTDIPDTGRFALVASPSGAVISPTWRWKMSMPRRSASGSSAARCSWRRRTSQASGASAIPPTRPAQ